MSTVMLVGATVVDFSTPSVEAKDLVLHDGRITDPGGAFPTTSTIDCRGCFVTPGFVVGHTHLYSGLAAGMPGPKSPTRSFREILEGLWWRLDRALDADSLRSSVQCAALTALRAGTTCVIDHHESPHLIDGALDIVAEALEEIGLRGCLTYGATERNRAGECEAGLAECERFTKKAADHPTLRGAIGLHAPFTVSTAALEAAEGLAQTLGCFLHFHAAEGPDDQRMAQERFGTRLFTQLAKLGLLHDRTLAAHAVDIDPAEAEAIRQSGTWIAHQPRSNMNNGVGYAAEATQLERLALGTDGIDNDALAELRAAFFRGREATGPAVWRDPLSFVTNTHDLASAIFGTAVGTLAPGACADLVVWRFDPATPIDAGNLGGHLLFGWRGATVRDVFVSGRPVLRNGRFVNVDADRIFNRGREEATRLWQRMEAI